LPADTRLDGLFDHGSRGALPDWLPLQERVSRYVGRGYRVLSQTEQGVQLVRPKQFSFVWATAWFLLCGVGVLVYVFYYASKKDDTLYLRA